MNAFIDDGFKKQLDKFSYTEKLEVKDLTISDTKAELTVKFLYANGEELETSLYYEYPQCIHIDHICKQLFATALIMPISLFGCTVKHFELAPRTAKILEREIGIDKFSRFLEINLLNSCYAVIDSGKGIIAQEVIDFLEESINENGFPFSVEPNMDMLQHKIVGVPFTYGKESLLTLALLQQEIQCSHILTYSFESFKDGKNRSRAKDPTNRFGVKHFAIQTNIYDFMDCWHPNKENVYGYMMDFMGFVHTVFLAVARGHNYLVDCLIQGDEANSNLRRGKTKYPSKYWFQSTSYYPVMTGLWHSMEQHTSLASFLNKYHEIQVLAMLSNYPNYMNGMTSCDWEVPGKPWCGECNKCMHIIWWLCSLGLSTRAGISLELSLQVLARIKSVTKLSTHVRFHELFQFIENGDRFVKGTVREDGLTTCYLGEDIHYLSRVHMAVYYLFVLKDEEFTLSFFNQPFTNDMSYCPIEVEEILNSKLQQYGTFWRKING